MTENTIKYRFAFLIVFSIVAVATMSFVAMTYLQAGNLDGLEWKRLLSIVGLFGILMLVGTLLSVPLSKHVIPIYRNHPNRVIMLLIGFGCLFVIAGLAGYATLLPGIWAIACGFFLRRSRAIEAHPAPSQTTDTDAR